MDENKLLEIQKLNTQVMSQTADAIATLENAINKKQFDVKGDKALETVLHYGNEVNRRLDWWLKEFMGPVVKQAFDHWKSLCAKRDMIAKPLNEKKMQTALIAGVYKSERDIAKKKEQEAIEKERLAEQEKERLERAEELAKEGKTEEADELLEKPIFVAPAVLPSAPDVKGTSYRKVWKFEVMDESKVPCDFHMVDTVKLGQYARTFKEKSSVPGVRFYSEDKASFSKRGEYV